MAQTTEAIFTNGVLKPLQEVMLPENQRVRLIIEPVENARMDRDEALARLRAGIAEMQFFSTGKLPFRDELHDRS